MAIEFAQDIFQAVEAVIHILESFMDLALGIFEVLGDFPEMCL